MLFVWPQLLESSFIKQEGRPPGPLPDSQEQTLRPGNSRSGDVKTSQGACLSSSSLRLKLDVSPVQSLVPKIVCTVDVIILILQKRKLRLRRWKVGCISAVYSEKTGSEP